MLSLGFKGMLVRIVPAAVIRRTGKSSKRNTQVIGCRFIALSDRRVNEKPVSVADRTSGRRAESRFSRCRTADERCSSLLEWLKPAAENNCSFSTGTFWLRLRMQKYEKCGSA